MSSKWTPQTVIVVVSPSLSRVYPGRVLNPFADLLVQAGAEIFKIQVTSLTDVAPDRLFISGVGSGFLVCACLCLFFVFCVCLFPHGW
jgi:hypothetical protein